MRHEVVFYKILNAPSLDLPQIYCVSCTNEINIIDKTKDTFKFMKKEQI